LLRAPFYWRIHHSLGGKGGARYDFGANFTSLHSHTVELDLIHAKLVKLNIIQQLPSRKPLDPGPPMTKTSFTATEMASPCNWAPWPPSRFDRSSANSEKPLRCVAIRSKKSGRGLKRVWCRLFASPVFQPLIALPSSLVLPSTCAPLSLLPSFLVPARARLPSFCGCCCCRCRKRKTLPPCTYIYSMAAQREIRGAQPYSVQA
jgi:hypothetical protein